MARCVRVIMDVMALPARAVFGIFPEPGFELLEQVSFRSEVGDVPAFAHGLPGLMLHFLTVVTVVAVALNHRCLDTLAIEDLLERLLDIGCTGAG